MRPAHILLVFVIAVGVWLGSMLYAMAQYADSKAAWTEQVSIEGANGIQVPIRNYNQINPAGYAAK